MQGVPVSNFVSVMVNITPAGAIIQNFNTLLLLGSSDVIDVSQRFRSYESIEDVAVDFGSNTEEYEGATRFFGQTPRPQQLYIGRWARQAAAARLNGGVLSAGQQALSAWAVVTNGGFHIAVDGGGSTNVTGLNFSAATTLDAVAAIIAAGLTGATCFWDSSQNYFIIESNTSGSSSAISFLTAPTSGTDISGQLKMQTGQGTQIARIAAETPLAAVQIFDALPNLSFYGLMFGDSEHLADSDHVAVAGYIEAASNPHLYWARTSNVAALSNGDTTTLGYLFKNGNYNRSFAYWSSSTLGNEADAALPFGKGFVIDFNASNSEYTLMWKELAVATPELLSGPQAQNLDANRYTYYAQLNDGIAILVNGAAGSGVFFDTMQGVDWLASAIQTEVVNLLVSQNKVPQTDAGNQLLTTAMARACDKGVNNGLVGPGTWNAGGFGNLVTGQFLQKGYYIYAPPLASQSESDRAARKSVPFQIAVKLAGANQYVVIGVNVNQ